MANDSFYRNTWIGVGAKYGGQLALGGFDTSDGQIFNLEHSNWNYTFNLENFRMGPGLGGGIGTIIIIAFNTTNIVTLSGTDISDWGFNCSVGPKWDKMAKALVNLKKYAALVKLGSMAAKDVEGAKLAAHYLWNSFDMANRKNMPTIFTLDLPIGYGLEVSLVKTWGKFEII